MSLSFASLPLSLAPGLTPGGVAYAKTMPGVTAPFGLFDPLGLTPETKEELLLFREAELAHGRVAMMGALGFLVQSHFAPMYDMDSAPVIRHLDKVLQTENGQLGSSCLLLAIFFSEIQRARTGWVEPEVAMRTLREGYLPGDLGFDPMGLKPKGEAELLAMQNKELNNGRLAMLAIAGMTAQELVTGQQNF
ncbi:light harvesting protein [Emiliania huxleyi CCMP1516]|uniref:Light harvesting protein n=4 Tax=Emiliania huxleyi TaxID=2903 RepID=A0A0D3IBH2_EMIH1|nr:light harvesting protein [Emiliania huxleyi CCMP1516]EOD08607.1 light harvesting protein [Emiliania huxleyi CCMP1516]|mmetsp:Transcript_27945/g.83502  ORF Transcript_27945/g.83502 Transcript_27945/m.83502 type:complete len:192 (-) Transcript_27945:305-880(-)|eukprot:XP_005761036.1 light harvesting protein [Emiliania huxleyi CCMP1516]